MHIVQKDEHETEPVSWEAAVSSWVDGEGEMRADELDSPYGRQLWDTYHLIGDVLRTEELAITPSPMFYARLSRAIDAEPSILAPAKLQRPSWNAGLSGIALAATVVAVAWIVVPYFMVAAPQHSPVVPAPQIVSIMPDDDTVLHGYVDAHQGLIGVIPVQQVSYAMGGMP